MKERIVTGIIGGIFFVLVLFAGGVWFNALASLLAIVGYYELLRMAKIKPFGIPSIIGFAAIALLFSKLFLNYEILDMSSIIIVESLLLLSLVVMSKNVFTFEKAAVLLSGILYIGIGFLYFAEARGHKGFEYILLVLLLIWSTDSGAYFVGRAIGKRKLFEAISPKKTIEGAVGGVVIALLTAWVFKYISAIEMSWMQVTITAILVSVFGQFGDLVESAIKRHYEIKDSGKILPGHGGVLDRFDSLLFVFPILHLLKFF